MNNKDSIGNLFDVNGRVVVITGGFGQLGQQFATALLSSGACPVLLDLHTDSSKLSQTLRDNHADGRLMLLQADVTKRSSLEKALDEIISTFGTPYGLINNAALDSPPGASAGENGPFETYPEESWDKVMDVNVKGVFLACQVYGGCMAKMGRGSIINIGSVYGMVSPDQKIYEYRWRRGETFFKPVAYSSSKSALLNLTRYLAVYWGDKGVRTNTLTFGGVFNNQDDEFLQNYCSKVSLGRMASESEYNGAVVFLMSDASSYMSGSNMVLDGGWTAL